MVSQLTRVTSDGQPSENAQMDCVAASICAGLLCLLGKSGVDESLNPDCLKDEADGQNYTGATAAVSYVPSCERRGVKLWPLDGEPAYLVRMAHSYLAQGCPVLFTEPDPYVPQEEHLTHVCVLYASDDGAGTLTAMDPYIARPVRKSDAEWTALLLDTQIWIMERMQQDVIIDLSMSDVAAYFKADPNNNWICLKNDKVIAWAMLDFYRRVGNADCCGLTLLGLPISNEIPVAGYAGIVIQFFEHGCACYDPKRELGNPPGNTSPVYLLNVYDLGRGADPRLNPALALVAQLEQALKDAQQQQNPQDSADWQAIKQIVAKH